MQRALSGLNLLLRRLAGCLPAEFALRRVLSASWNTALVRLNAKVDVPLHGTRLRLHAKWRSLAPDYERLALGSFLDRIGPDTVVWDVGAYIGIYSLLAAQRLKGSGRLAAWEASPQTFRKLKEHATLNGLGENCRLYLAAVNDGSTDSVTFSCDNAENDASINRMVTSLNEKAVRAPVTVFASSLDGWQATLQERPDVIKMDIEGAEVSALKGATRLLGGDGKRPWILLSVHPHFIWEFGSTLAELGEVVARLGYVSLSLEGKPAPLTEHAEYWVVPASDAPDASRWLQRLYHAHS